ncbi:DUF3616 domain-containing protein [Nonomuraea africana]|uniref:DUF3616 domain-containing protein n=1 Tax=Nonomuraea africana TaxID=46171 RepID=A0ABR9K7Y8_9ACTN|nr:DUF3616 domain-containing protein [Nonomuraea africana]MBE1557925.1 hypothetical protein [Nonomuraea africana]
MRADATGLWIAGDETATIERLNWTGERYDHQRTFHLADFVDLPAGREDEADIEGLARADGWLWAVGSHSLKRRRAKSREKAARRLSAIIREPNRFILVRLPLEGAGLGKGAILTGLADALAEDAHLGPFTAIPGKDNGLDVEGLAVLGERVFLGLRGPVLRGWAVVLELDLREDGPHRLKLKGYHKHFLDLGGLGVRDLCPYDGDLLLLTGPTMDLDGPVRIMRWDGIGAPVPVADLPYGVGCDHPEGLAALGDGRLMVVYDSPSPARLTPEGGVLADLVTI